MNKIHWLIGEDGRLWSLAVWRWGFYVVFEKTRVSWVAGKLSFSRT